MEKINSYTLTIASSNHQVIRTKVKVENSLLARQNVVGGCIAIHPLTTNIDIIYCEDYSTLNKQDAWLIYDEQGNEQLILYGTLLCLRYQNDNYTSLEPDDYDKIDSLVIPISILNEFHERNGKKILYTK